MFLLRRNYKKVWIEPTASQKIYAHIHKPWADRKYPGVVIVPGGFSPGTAYDKRAALTAQEISAKGFVVLHYDPSGRGKSSGTENCWGTVHQKELAFVLDYFSSLSEVDSDNIGVLSFSIGITIAAGALARFSNVKVKYLFDWEGPSNRFITTQNDTYEPVANFPTLDDDFWKEREAVKFIGDIECGYFRYQADIDHVQGKLKDHAIELINKATKGKAAWTQSNDNPANTIFDINRPDKYKWIPEKTNNKDEILKFILEIQKKSYEPV